MGLKSWLATKAIQGKLPRWVYRLVGERLAKVFDLKEDNQMADETTDAKPWYKSKAKLAAVVMAVVSLIQPVSTAFGHPMQVPLWVIEVLTGLGIYGVRDALKS